jgi:hypothetical protein
MKNTPICIAFFAFVAFAVLAFTVRNEHGALKEKVAPFELDIVTFNHAQQSFDGQMCYHITQDSLVIRRYFMWQSLSEEKPVEDTLVCKSLGNKPALEQLSNIKLAHLNDFYTNEQVMITSGNEIFVRLKRDGTEKEISLHAMTIPEVEELFAVVNEIVPKKYRLE